MPTVTTDLIVVDVRTAVLVRIEEGVQLALQAGVIQSLGDEMPSGACLNVGHSRIEMQHRRAVEQLFEPRRLDAAGRIAPSVSAQALPDHIARVRERAAGGPGRVEMHTSQQKVRRQPQGSPPPAEPTHSRSSHGRCHPMPHGRSHGDTRMSAELRYLRRAL